MEEIRLYDLNYEEKRKLCELLDSKNCFFELGQHHMRFEENLLKYMLNDCHKKNTSPHERLLTEWTLYDHTILELFILLKRIKQFEAMQILKGYVPTKYHYLMKPKQTSEKILNGPVQSHDDNVTRAPLTPDIEDSIPLIPYEELQKATNDWAASNVLGKGGFGVVFKGLLRCTEVAIKRINRIENSPESEEESYRELRFLNANRHDNVLSLYACSKGGPHHCLVYQFMPGGSLERRLHTMDSSLVLSWSSRLNIARGTALGLHFLHTIRDRPLIHADIKSANILLDANDCPRIGDFGLAREGPIGDYYMKVSRIQGTRPYLPKDFLESYEVCTKVDTYSFGVVLFELGTGASPYSNKRRDKFLRDHVVNYDQSRLDDLKDRKVLAFGDETYMTLMQIGLKCVREAARDRPEMVDVYKMLKDGK